jgi:hypothetical protein
VTKETQAFFPNKSLLDDYYGEGTHLIWRLYFINMFVIWHQSTCQKMNAFFQSFFHFHSKESYFLEMPEFA